jgi:hypothetical protein
MPCAKPSGCKTDNVVLLLCFGVARIQHYGRSRQHMAKKKPMSSVVSVFGTYKATISKKEQRNNELTRNTHQPGRQPIKEVGHRGMQQHIHQLEPRAVMHCRIH